jgi:hypothetical protein
VKELIGSNGLRCVVVRFYFLLSFAISLVTYDLRDSVGSVVTGAILLLIGHYFQYFSIYQVVQQCQLID